MPGPTSLLAALDEGPDAPLEELRRREDAWQATHRESLRFAYPMLALAERLAPGTVDVALLARLRRASTPRALAITMGMTPTAPILDTRFSLRQRLMWSSGVGATTHRLWRMFVPLEGADTRRRLRTYRHRAIRLLSLALRARPRRSDRGDG